MINVAFPRLWLVLYALQVLSLQPSQAFLLPHTSGHQKFVKASVYSNRATNYNEQDEELILLSVSSNNNNNVETVSVLAQQQRQQQQKHHDVVEWEESMELPTGAFPVHSKSTTTSSSTTGSSSMLKGSPPSGKYPYSSVQSTKNRRAVTEQEEQARDQQDQFFLLLAILPSVLAFFAWEEISRTLAVLLDTYGAIGRAVDGGQFTTNLLRPTITGVVVPVISIALATLVSTTVNVLRARQVELRALINKESCEIRLLRRAVLGMFGTRQHAPRRAQALALLCGYVEQLERECSEGAVLALEELQLSGGIAVNELDQMAEMLHGVDGAAASRQGSVGVAEGLILSLNGHRSDRVALLLSVFPVIHWGVLIALSLSVCLAFLLNSNQQVLQYLNSVQLRLLFAILVGVFSGTATLCLDLADPFRGSFSIAEASTQLEDLRLCLKKDVVEACAEEGEISSRVVHALLLGRTKDHTSDSAAHFQRSRPFRESFLLSEVSDGEERPSFARRVRSGDDAGSRRYGLASTIYFHLLTGPLGSNARVLGDVIAWISSFVARWTRSVSQRVVSVSNRVMGKVRWLPRWRRATSAKQ